MKKISSLINKNILERKSFVDEKSIFYVFSLLISDEYGKQGIKNIKIILFKNKKISISASNSNWANEIFSNKEYLIEKINSNFQTKEVVDIAIVV